MADAMCGPSNALKGLSQHVERDRSRQQDRFVSGPQAAAQNFRSSPAQSSVADANFAAFQSGSTTLPGIHDGGPAALGLYAPSPAGPTTFQPMQPQAQNTWQLNTPAQLSHPAHAQHGQDWAKDFQQMSISDPVQRGLHPTAFHTSQPQFDGMFGNQRPGWNASPFGYNSQMAPMPMQMPGMAAASSQPVQAEDDFDFDAAMSQWMAANAGPEQEVAESSSLANALQERATEQENLAGETILSPENVILDGIDSRAAIEETVLAQETEEMRQEPDNGELARAARQVVESVSNETNDKFAKSDFFAFMRRLGNEEIVLRGTEFVEASAAGAESRSAESGSGSGSHITGQTSAVMQDSNDKGNQPAMQASVQDA